MPKDSVLRPPVLARCLVRAASWIVPARVRPRWREKWDTALWNWWILYERGELTRRDQVELISYSWGSFTDALQERMSPEQMRHTLRSPGFVLAAAAAALIAVAVFSDGFAATRAFFRPYPIPDPDSLVAISYSGSADQPSGVPPAWVPFWRTHSSTLTDLAAYYHLPYAANASVTDNFFSVLGVHAVAGRLFQPGDKDVAVISGSTWRAVYGSDPRAIGTQIAGHGGEYTIIGVLPEAFWAISPRIAVWTPLIIGTQPAPDMPFLIGTVGRLKNGETPAKVRMDLYNARRAAHLFIPRPPRVSDFTGVPDRPLFRYLVAIVFAIAIGVFMIALGDQPFSIRHSWRYWSFLASKTVLLIAVPSLLWVEIMSRLPEGVGRTEMGLVFFGVVLTLLYLAVGAYALWWSFADQRQRCPVCLQRMAMPVTMGSWSSVLEPVTTEFMCESGHGSLCIPETESGERDRWTSLDPSWRELFYRK